MVSNHRLVLFTHALCRLSYPAACGLQGSPPRTLSTGERSITSGYRLRQVGDPAELAASHQIAGVFAALANVRMLIEIRVVEKGFDAYEPHSLAAARA